MNQTEEQQRDPDGLKILLISVHGLIRGHDLELGRDADTGGQVLYVVELARALARNPKVSEVVLLTRQVFSKKVSEDYAQPEEDLGDGARIVRIPCGPRRYFYKEALWPYMPLFIDNTMRWLRQEKFDPDLIHGHYADAGLVAARLSSILGKPMIFTGHSLGRVKRQRLMASGTKESTIERRFRMSTRIEAEEVALDHAGLVITSTQQEIEEQYELYHNYNPQRKKVVPPGLNLERFSPQKRGWGAPPVAQKIQPFLKNPKKPLIFAIARADARKNHGALVKAFGEHPELQEMANVLLVMGSREDIREMEKGTREVLTNVLLDIDKYNLYGKIAYPKSHTSDDVPDMYRLAASTKGIFVNPALTEPFGLTLLEAASCGLPVLATSDGGPKDIIENCRNGMLIDPLNTEEIAEKLMHALSDRHQWNQWSKNGIEGVRKYYTWDAHVRQYLESTAPLIEENRRQKQFKRKVIKTNMATFDRLLICDIDNTLTGDREALARLNQMLEETDARVGFGIATGRNFDLVKEAMAEWNIPKPSLYITSVGSKVYYGDSMQEDKDWKRHIDYRWEADKIREVMENLPGLVLQPEENQEEHKISYYWDEEYQSNVQEIHNRLRAHNLSANVIASHGSLVDILPIRCSKGMAIRFFADKWRIPVEHILVAGDSGNDIGMLRGNTLGVVVGNYSKEVETLRGRPRVYFAPGHHSQGIIDGIIYYNFLGEIRPDGPQTEGDESSEGLKTERLETPGE